MFIHPELSGCSVQNFHDKEVLGSENLSEMASSNAKEPRKDDRIFTHIGSVIFFLSSSPVLFFTILKNPNRSI